MEAAAPSLPRVESNFLARVFAWMFLGLAVTGGIAAWIGSNEELLATITESPGIIIGVVVGQLALVLFLSFAIQRIPPALARVLFLAYAALVGVTFAFLFELYTTESIFTTFLICSAMFGALAVFGAVTDMDLSKLGPILFAALIGLILATIVNIFVANSTLYWITTYAGVIIFAGLTAYDMQKLKQISEQGLGEREESQYSIFGALALYLDFINLFIFLLRIFGQRR